MKIYYLRSVLFVVSNEEWEQRIPWLVGNELGFVLERILPIYFSRSEGRSVVRERYVHARVHSDKLFKFGRTFGCVLLGTVSRFLLLNDSMHI